jgi:hypothetical protein
MECPKKRGKSRRSTLFPASHGLFPASYGGLSQLWGQFCDIFCRVATIQFLLNPFSTAILRMAGILTAINWPFGRIASRDAVRFPIGAINPTGAPRKPEKPLLPLQLLERTSLTFARLAWSAFFNY